MFINLFKALRRLEVPVTFNEWLLLQNALSENLADSSLTRFYHLARAILVKTEAHFDKFDQAFLECFGHIESNEELLRTIEEKLKKMPPLELTEEEKRIVEKLDLEEVRSRFLDQLRSQDDKPHIGGNRAIGTRGRSPYGAWGYNPAGVRIGQHESRMRSAIQIAEKRKFRNYRDDMTLDTRSIKTVLSYIRQVVREGPKDSLGACQSMALSAPSVNRGLALSAQVLFPVQPMLMRIVITLGGIFYFVANIFEEKRCLIKKIISC